MLPNFFLKMLKGQAKAHKHVKTSNLQTEAATCSRTRTCFQERDAKAREARQWSWSVSEEQTQR